MNRIDPQELYQVTEVEITYKNTVHHDRRIILSNAADAYHILRRTWDPGRIGLQEQFKILLIKGDHCVGIAELATGGTSSCPVDPKLIMVTALKANAAAIILAHNHPSGNLKPSQLDIALTDKLCRAGKLLDIDVLDHLILTSHSYCSLGDEGLMPSGTAARSLHPELR